MGLFDLFGGKKQDKVTEEEREQNLQDQKEKELEEAKAAHEGLEWPEMPRLNPVNIKDGDNLAMNETVTQERKEEIGPMIYEDDIPSDTLKFFSCQELLFLLTTLEVFNKKAPLPGYEKNHRKVYNEVLGRVRDSKTLYVLYDMATGYPFVDHGYANIYLEEDIAKRAGEMFVKQFRKLVAREIKVEAESENAAQSKTFYDFLYYLGINNLVVDNGAYRMRFKRNEIMADPGQWNSDEKSQEPKNPALNFAMLDFVGELRWPVKYEKRAEVLTAKESRMLSLIRKSRFIVPMQHEGPMEVSEDGRLKINKASKLKFLVLKTPDGKEFLPVYTDMFEFRKKDKGTEWDAAVFAYADIIRFAVEKDGITINPEGLSLVLAKDRIAKLEEESSKAEAAKVKAVKKNAAGKTADAAVQQALNQAMAKMNEKNED
ncbi:MAG: SseB family protein [Butyrivibrio sp.]|nr:SseB family protein [Butyrivibrio sp.]